MGETVELLEDVEKQIQVDNAALKEARLRRNKVLAICGKFDGVLNTFASGSVAMGVVNEPLEDADGGMTLDRRHYRELGPDGAGESPEQVVSDLHGFVGPAVREIWPDATVHDMKRGITVRMHAPLLTGVDPYVDVVVALNRKNASGLWIPNISADRWDPSHPQYHVDLMVAGTMGLRRTRARVVRLAKAWNKQYSQPALNSFNLVALALESITETMSIDQALSTFFDHAANSLKVRLTDDPAGISGPINTELKKDVAVARLASAQGYLANAIEADDDVETVAEELHKLFWCFLPEPRTAASKASVAAALRQGTPRFRHTTSGIAIAGAVTPKRSFGGSRG